MMRLRKPFQAIKGYEWWYPLGMYNINFLFLKKQKNTQYGGILAYYFFISIRVREVPTSVTVCNSKVQHGNPS